MDVPRVSSGVGLPGIHGWRTAGLERAMIHARTALRARAQAPLCGWLVDVRPTPREPGERQDSGDGQAPWPAYPAYHASVLQGKFSSSGRRNLDEHGGMPRGSAAASALLRGKNGPPQSALSSLEW